MRSDTLALRDQLLARLRDRGGPMTSSELADGLPPRFYEREPCNCRIRRLPLMNSATYVEHCDGLVHDVYLAPNPQAVYVQMRALERKGAVARLDLGPATRTRPWIRVDWTDTDDELAELEAAWADS